jgi:hypothetical protein
MTDIEQYIMDTPILNEEDFPDPEVANLEYGENFTQLDWDIRESIDPWIELD